MASLYYGNKVAKHKHLARDTELVVATASLGAFSLVFATVGQFFNFPT